MKFIPLIIISLGRLLRTPGQMMTCRCSKPHLDEINVFIYLMKHKTLNCSAKGGRTTILSSRGQA